MIVNSPNNPTGVVYSEETIQKMAEILRKKEAEYGISIYLVSDEPYRELAYDGVEVPYLTRYYRNTIVGYSYSKSLSLPGERIGYLVIPDEADDCETVIGAANVANRILGFVNAPSLLQLAVIARCLDATTLMLEHYDAQPKAELYEGSDRVWALSCAQTGRGLLSLGEVARLKTIWHLLPKRLKKYPYC